jgi:hypothetical protein
MTYQAFRRVAVDDQVAQHLETTTIPAPTRGIILDENESFMQPGAAVVMDNWKPTLKGAALRGGCIRWCVLPETTPVISAFPYDNGNDQKMFAANATKLYDVTTASPVLIASGRTSGNYSAAQFNTLGGEFLIAANDTGDSLLRYDGTSWETLVSGYVPPGGKPPMITGPAGTSVEHGQNLTYVAKYRGRLFFLEGGSMNAWYLPLNSVGGALSMVPLSGAATKGGKLLFIAIWSTVAGNNVDDKIVFGTDLGELIVFTGSDPSDANNWNQEGRYESAAPMGMNAHINLGGELLLMTVQGIVPISLCTQKSPEQLELAAITKPIKRMWRDEVAAKRGWNWTIANWEMFGGLFVTWPGSKPGYCAVVNAATGAWARFVGYDATCWIRLRDDFFFGTTDGKIMQADHGGYDDGQPYVATIVGGWEMFQSPAQMCCWRQARANFFADPDEVFVPQITAATDYVVTIPPPPPAGEDPGPQDLWDEGLWDTAKWDAPGETKPAMRNTMWVSVGATGFSHAPVVQVTVAQQATPEVELISISAIYERYAFNV